MRVFGFSINHKQIYFYLLILTAICLSVSRFALSMSMILLIANYVFEFDFKRKLNRLKQDKSILIFVLVFVIHLIWLINTSNFKFAFHDLGNKAILLLYPVIIGTSEKLSIKHIQIIINWFVASLFVSSLISLFILLGATGVNVTDTRDISPFMSHIRLSLLVNMAIFSLIYFRTFRPIEIKSFEKIAYGILIIWFVVFLFLLKSLTGIFIFLFIGFGSLLYVSFKHKNKLNRLFILAMLLLVVLSVGFVIGKSISEFYHVEKVDLEKLDQKTQMGNRYKHYKKNKQIENGNYVWLFVCDKELKKEWEKKSTISYSGIDKKQQSLRTTLIRYMSSKGFRKDSLGFSSLSETDIRNIESGMANYIFENKYAIYPIIYKVIWEVDVYRKGHNPAGNSITQRLEYLKAAKEIVKQNFYWGVGTGDVKDAFLNEYDRVNSKLPIKRRLRAHNQYVTFLLTFGIFGFLMLFYCMFYPAYKKRAFSHYLFVVFITIALLSFINEDTLETQIGITFFSYFYSLFLFGSNLFLKEGKEYV